MYGLIGKMRTHPGQRDELLDLLLRAAKLLPEVEGCYSYIISSDPNDPEGIWVTEVWRSQADHQASLNHEQVREVIMAGRPLIAEFAQRFEVTPLGGMGLPESAT